MRNMEERDRQDQEKGAQRATKAVKAVAKSQKVSTKEADPQTPFRPRPAPGRCAVRFQTVDPTARLGN